MENLSNMKEIQQEDLLDRQLREVAPYIDDEGFTGARFAAIAAPAARTPLVPGCHSFDDHVACERTGLSTLGRRTFSRGRGNAADDLPTLWLFVSRSAAESS